MRIVALEAQNVKALRAVSIVPNGNVIQIAGENGAGKSSVLDSICFALGGKKLLPSQPVRRGELSAVVSLDLGDVLVTRRFDAEGGTSVEVSAPSGAVFRSPQTLLDSLFGHLTFDPLRFALAEPKQALETLRGLVKLDVDIDALDRENARDYELRRDWNRKVASLKERVASHAAALEPDAPTALVDIDALTAKIVEASEHNATIDRLKVARRQMQVGIDILRKQGQDRRAQAEDLKRQAAEMVTLAEGLERNADAEAETLSNVEALPEPIDVSDVRNAINEGMRANAATNERLRQREAHGVAVGELAASTEASERLTAAMDARTRRRADAIASAKMPIDGLGFGAGEVLYKGLPFDQASQGERIRVSFAVAVAMSPKLRVALIRDGSLLDAKNLALVEQLAEEGDFQVWLERVGDNKNVGILIEDGQIAAIDGTRIDTPADGADVRELVEEVVAQ